MHMNTQKLAQEPRVPAQTVQSVVNMQPGSTNASVAREGEAIQAARLLKKKPKNGSKDDLSRFGLHD